MCFLYYLLCLVFVDFGEYIFIGDFEYIKCYGFDVDLDVYVCWYWNIDFF